MEGFVQLAHYSAFNPDKNMQAFNAKFKKKFGLDANIMAGAYDAVLFYRTDVPEKFGKTWEAVKGLQGRISTRDMIAMNAAAELDRRPFAQVAAQFLAPQASGSAAAAEPARRSFLDAVLAPDLGRLTAEHFALVFASLVLSIAAGVPLGIWAERAGKSLDKR